MSPDTIVPDPSNPQDLNRFSYVRNNPIRYNDPTGHMCSDPDDPTPSCDGSGGTPSNTPAPLPDAPVVINNPGPLDDGQEQGDPTPTPNPTENGLLDPEPVNQPWYSGITSWVTGILSNPYTSVATSSIQVLTGTTMLIAAGFMVVPGAGEIAAAVFLGAFIANRVAAIVGLAATSYQYNHNLNGVTGVDVAVSYGTTLVGTAPQYSEGAGLVSFFYNLSDAPPLNQIGEYKP